MDIIFTSCSLTINGLGMLVNFVVVVIFLRFRNKLLSKNNNKFLFSMAVADCFVSLFGIAGTVLFDLHQAGFVGRAIWKLCGALPLFGSFHISILSLTLMTADRLIAVVYALRYHTIMTEYRANVLICLTWLIVSIMLVIQGAILMEFPTRFELRVRTYQLTAFFSLGTVVLCIGNVKLYLIIRSKQLSTVFPCGIKEASEQRTYKRHRNNMTRIALDGKICFWMTASFLICWLPVTVNYIGYINGYFSNKLAYTICMSIAAFDTVLTPIIYLVKRRDFRKRFGELFFGYRRERRESDITNNNSWHIT